MKKLIAFYKHTAEKSKGQALVLIAVAFIVLLVIVGLTTDVGFLFIRYGELRRAVDAAALAGAAQLREGRWIDDITAAAEQTVALNGIDSANVIVEMCKAGGDDLCEGDPPKKLVRVRATTESQVFFMRLLGIEGIPIEAYSVAQAASLDVILVIDVSQSMAYDGEKEDVYNDKNTTDPAFCNRFAGDDPDPDNPNPDDRKYPCQPFYQVKQAAKGFAAHILEVSIDNPDLVDEVEADRLGIVTFATGWMFDRETAGATAYWMEDTNGWTTDYDVAAAAIDGLRLYEGYDCSAYADDKDHLGSCLDYLDTGDYFGLGCLTLGTHDDESTCPTTSIGAGLQQAAALYSLDERPNSLRIVVLLTDGVNNASLADSEDCNGGTTCTNQMIYENVVEDSVPETTFGYCPVGPGYSKCHDEDARSETRTIVDPDAYPQCPMWLSDEGAGYAQPDCPSGYDADDFAMDVADFLACDPTNSKCVNDRQGQGVIIFTIGMGQDFLSDSDRVRDPADRPYGVYLLRYIANVGDDGDPSTDPCDGLYNEAGYSESCGNFYFVEDPNKLDSAFEAIASRIFTRISQ